MDKDQSQEKNGSNNVQQESSVDEEQTKIPVEPHVGDSDSKEHENVEYSVDDLLAERDKLKDQLLRAMADTENMRRRTEREMQSARKYGHTNFARDLVGAIDNLARAIEVMENSEADENGSEHALQGLIKGIELSWTEIQSIIEKHGIKKIDPVGEKFDYNLHQAMFELPTEEQEPGIVVEVVQHGYVLHDRLLRPAMVGVSKPPDSSPKEVDAKA